MMACHGHCTGAGDDIPTGTHIAPCAFHDPPAERINAARAQELRKRSELDRARLELRAALEAGKASGLTLQQLAELVGLTRQRVHELLS
jgi:hypothetical protein